VQVMVCFSAFEPFVVFSFALLEGSP
jgi:hypothetical protein